MRDSPGFFKFADLEAVSLSLLLGLCSICERTEEEPALLIRCESPWQCHIPWKYLLVATFYWETSESASCISVPAHFLKQLQILNPYSKLEWSSPVSLLFCGEEQSYGNQRSRM